MLVDALVGVFGNNLPVFALLFVGITASMRYVQNSVTELRRR